MHEDLGRVLVFAGSDSGGGAGLQADVKTITALGGHAMTAVTAVTVQNTLGVSAVHALPAHLVEAQARAVLDDLGADAIKTGLLGGPDVVARVAALIDEAGRPAVVDPVMVASSGDRLAPSEALDAVRDLLVPRATLLTPNAPEAEALTGLSVADEAGQRVAGERLLALGARAVLMKGGHIPGARVVDLLVTPVGVTRFESGRIRTRNTHGTGCTLASGIACGLSQGLGLEHAVARARDYLLEAIRRAPHLGSGCGPLDHGWPMRPGGPARLLDASAAGRGRA